MEGRRYATGTTDVDFDLYRVYSPLIRAAARAVGKPTQRHEAGDTYNAVAVADGTVRTGTVSLQPPGVTAARRWRFTDGDSWSPTVHPVRGIGITLKPHVGTPPAFPVDAAIDLETTIAPGLGDPTVELSLIFPWETGSSHGMTVEDVLLDELAGEADPDEGFLREVLGFTSDYLPGAASPGWELFIQPNVLDIDPSPNEGAPWWAQASEHTVLWIRASSPGRLAVAVHVVDRSDPDLAAVSTVIAIERAADETITVLYSDADD